MMCQLIKDSINSLDNLENYMKVDISNKAK